VVVKGILTAEHARFAVEHGADGLIVSNHGGRQLDGTPATIAALPAVVDAVGDRAEIVLDSGIRRGTDVLKAMALGADFVFVGRPFNYAASIGGEAGVKRAYDILQGEVLRGLGQVGLERLAELGPQYLMRTGGVRSPGMPL
jgi:L-lactate dehydrogenase (cytochrome)